MSALCVLLQHHFQAFLKARIVSATCLTFLYRFVFFVLLASLTFPLPCTANEDKYRIFVSYQTRYADADTCTSGRASDHCKAPRRCCAAGEEMRLHCRNSSRTACVMVFVVSIDADTLDGRTVLWSAQTASVSKQQHRPYNAFITHVAQVLLINYRPKQ